MRFCILSPTFLAWVLSGLLHACAAGFACWYVVSEITPDEQAQLNCRAGKNQAAATWSPAQAERAPRANPLQQPNAAEPECARLSERLAVRRPDGNVRLLELSQQETAGTAEIQPPRLPREQVPRVAAADSATAANQEPAVELRPVAIGPRQAALRGQTASTATSGTEEFVSPQFIHNPKPDYGRIRNPNGKFFVTLLEIHISASGAVTRVEVLQSSGYPQFDQHAVEAVRKWRAIPARRAGVL